MDKNELEMSVPAAQIVENVWYDVKASAAPHTRSIYITSSSL